jgi:hypothetical protein
VAGLVRVWGVWVLREVEPEGCIVIPFLPYIPMGLFVVVYPSVVLWSVSEIADLTLEVALCPPRVKDFINHMLFFLSDCGGGLGCIHSLHHLIRCDRVELASVEHVVDSPTLGQFQSVCEWSHDLVHPEGPMSQGV